MRSNQKKRCYLLSALVFIALLCCSQALARTGFKMKTTDGETIYLTEYKAFKNIIEYTDPEGYLGVINRDKFSSIENIEDLDSEYRQYLVLMGKDTNAEIEVYTAFCTVLEKVANAVEGDHIIGRTQINSIEASMNKTNSFFGDKISEYLPDAYMPKELSNRIDELKSFAGGIEILAEAESAKGNHKEAVKLSTMNLLCGTLLPMKLMMEEYFVYRGISYEKKYINENLCQDVKTEAPVTPEPQSVYVANQSTILSNCKGKWGTNYEMVEYCVEQQSQAKRNLSSHGGQILDDCRKKWGDNYEMVEYCSNQQNQAKRNLEQYSGHILNSCRKKWGRNYEMIEYCVEQQTAAKERLGY